jgi:hypothetical protein
VAAPTILRSIISSSDLPSSRNTSSVCSANCGARRLCARAGQEVGDEHVGRADQFVEQRTSLYWYFRKKDDLLNAMTDIAVDG